MKIKLLKKNGNNLCYQIKETQCLTLTSNKIKCLILGKKMVRVQVPPTLMKIFKKYNRKLLIREKKN